MTFKPMLAVNAVKSKTKFPVMGSIKLEGVRGCFTPTGLMARSLKDFGNQTGLTYQFSDLVSYAMDKGLYIEGEFYVHRMEFNEISSICRRNMHPDTDEMQFHIFDVFDPCNSKSFLQRVNDIREVCASMVSIGQGNVHSIRQTLLSNWDFVQDMYESAVQQGYEGLVLKDPHGYYKHGRSTVNEGLFTRLKPEDTWDGVVVEIVEMMENLVESETNELGYLSKKQDKDMKAGKGIAAVAVVDCPDFEENIRVTLSRGLTDSDREQLWINRDDLLGKHLRFVGIPVKGMLPRSPRFDAWRPDLD